MTALPKLPEPALEDVPYELWGQNAIGDFFTAEQMRSYALAALEGSQDARESAAMRVLRRIVKHFREGGRPYTEDWLREAEAVLVNYSPGSQDAIDAARYRVIRDAYVKSQGVPSVKFGRDDAGQFDDAIDAALNDTSGAKRDE